MMLRHVSAVRMIWKRDLRLLALKCVDKKAVALAYNQLLKRKLIQEDDMSSRFRTVSITKAGKLYLANYGYETDVSINESKPFGTSDPNRIHKELTKVKIITLFRSAGAAVLPEEKPLLGKLLNTLAPMFKTEVSRKMYAEPTRTEIQRELEGPGYYYRAEEVRHFLNAQGTAMSDSIRGARFFGIYLRQNECFVVYAADPGNNRMLKISEPLEQRLVDLLGKYLNASLMFSVFRSVSGEAHRINAIVISDGNALVYEMVMGSRRGHIKGKPAVLQELKSERRDSEKRRHSIFRYDQQLYGRVFIIPANTNGSDCLSFLATHDTEHWISKGAALCQKFEKTQRSVIPELNMHGFCRETRLSLVYLPIYELKTLYEASVPDHSNNPTTGFLAPFWMHQTIRHCVRMKIPIYDSETGEADDTGIVFQRNGYVEGSEVPGKGRTKRYKRKRTSISCSAETHEMICAAAREAGVSVSNYFVRAAIEKARGAITDDRKDY